MAKRKREPEEAIGPVLDGMDQLERLEMALRPQPEPEEAPEPEQEPEPEAPQVMLICGSRGPALECARLAAKCGFMIELADDAPLPPAGGLAQLAQAVHLLQDYDNLVEECGIDKNHFVCVFVDSPAECEHIIYQCLPSDAAYVGAWADKEKRREIFARLKEDGAPDAELAAICCPMGLGIGSRTPEQDAVAVVAEMLAAGSGALKSLRYRG